MVRSFKLGLNPRVVIGSPLGQIAFAALLCHLPCHAQGRGYLCYPSECRKT